MTKNKNIYGKGFFMAGVRVFLRYRKSGYLHNLFISGQNYF